MEMDRSRQRIFEILIFIDFLLVIILNAGLIKNFLIEEDRTEQIFFINQVFDHNNFKCEFYKKTTS